MSYLEFRVLVYKSQPALHQTLYGACQRPVAAGSAVGQLEDGLTLAKTGLHGTTSRHNRIMPEP